MADHYSLTLPIKTLPPKAASPLKVLPTSTLQFRKYVERFATHFKREMAFDFIQFEASETSEKHYFTPWEAHLFHTPANDLWLGEGPVKSRLIGAACFRWRAWTNAPPEWILDWVWFHPYFRQRGHLLKAWPQFRDSYGKFGLAPPLSPSMERFMEKINRQEEQ